MKKRYLLIVLIIIVVGYFVVVNISTDEPLGDLTPVSEGEVIKHSRIKLAYSEENEQPFWVFYTLTPHKLNSSIKRTDDFRPDPNVSTFSSSLEDYKKSGYDRGHLCPAADMKYDLNSISESFLMSNMSPQVPSFNRGIWSKLESLVRAWGEVEDSLYIVTGPVFRNIKDTIGVNGVTVPGYYYKIIFDPTGFKKMIAFLLPNDKSSSPLERYVVSVDSLEQLTHIDFFPGISDRMERKLERKVSTLWWDFSVSANSVSYTASVTSDEPSPETEVTQKVKPKTAVQCLGTAKSTGQRCKSKTTNSNGYCTPHQKQAPQ